VCHESGTHGSGEDGGKRSGYRTSPAVYLAEVHDGTQTPHHEKAQAPLHFLFPFIATDLSLEAYFKHSRRCGKRRSPSRLFFAARSTIVEMVRQTGRVPEVMGPLAKHDVTSGILCSTRLSSLLREAKHGPFQRALFQQV